MTPAIIYRNAKKNDRWSYSRFTVADTRVPPSLFWGLWKIGYSVEQITGPDWYPWATREQVEAAIDWVQKRSDAAKRGWARRKDL